MNEFFRILELRDGFFAKDGRGWYTNVSGHTHSVAWPFPSTTAGAMRTAFGFSRETQGLNTEKDWKEIQNSLHIKCILPLYGVAGKNWSPKNRVWPHPADALLLEGRDKTPELTFLDPQPYDGMTLDQDEDPVRESLYYPRVKNRAKPLSPPLWWKEDLFAAWLAQEPVSSFPAQGVRMARRRQTHLKIKSQTLTAEEGMLFSTETVEGLIREPESSHFYQWGMALHLKMPESFGPMPETLWVGLGGKRHLNALQPGNEDLFAMPKKLRDAAKNGASGMRVFCVTPAVFDNGWLPDGFTVSNGRYEGAFAGIDVVLRAAFVPRAQAVSGFDMLQNAPKKTWRLVPPGSVYFLEKLDGKPFTAEEIECGWLSSWGAQTSDGYGTVVCGLWKTISK